MEKCQEMILMLPIIGWAEAFVKNVQHYDKMFGSALKKRNRAKNFTPVTIFVITKQFQDKPCRVQELYFGLGLTPKLGTKTSPGHKRV